MVGVPMPNVEVPGVAAAEEEHAPGKVRFWCSREQGFLLFDFRGIRVWFDPMHRQRYIGAGLHRPFRGRGSQPEEDYPTRRCGL